MRNDARINMDTNAKTHCMVVHAYYPIGETRVERESRALLDHGFEVDLICLGSKGEPAQEDVAGVNVYRLPVDRHLKSGMLTQLLEYISFFVLVFFKLIGLNRKRHYNVVQVHNLPDWLVFSTLIPKWMGAKIILDLHDLMPEFFAAKSGRQINSLPVKIMIWQEQISCQFADQVITVTENWKDTLIQRGLSPAKVSVVMNVADENVFSLEGGQSHNKNGHYQLFYHGNLTYRYGIDLAIRAVAIVKDQIPEVNLHIHGWGEYSQKLKDLTKELGLDAYVTFSSNSLPTAELPGLIRQADVCLVPYRTDIFTDGILPTKLMEYAALGVPAIASRTTTISRYFDESMIQFFSPEDVSGLADRILYLYQNPSVLAQMPQRLHEFNKRYSWSRISEEYANMVEKLGQRNKRGK